MEASIFANTVYRKKDKEMDTTATLGTEAKDSWVFESWVRELGLDIRPQKKSQKSTRRVLAGQVLVAVGTISLT